MRTLIALFTLILASYAQAQTCVTPAQLDTDLTAAAQGSVISLAGINPINCPTISMTETWSAGKLIFSDSPETPTTRGKLYEDGTLAATSGTDYNRIWYYHVNGKSGNAKMRLTALIKNTSGSSATLTVQKKGTAGPSTSFVLVGQLAFQRWIDSVASAGVVVAAGATVRLDSTFDAIKFTPGNLLHGIWDYSMTQTHQVTLCALDENDTALTVCPTLSVLARDVHDRGTFLYADKIYDTTVGTSVDTAAGIQQFGAGAVNFAYDTAVTGTDVTQNSAETLDGNIGVVYRMHLNLVSTDGQDLGWVINPRGGWWGSAAKSALGSLSSNSFLCPSTGGGMSDNTKACVVNRYTPGGGTSVWIQWMPTGGANLPVRFIAVPH